MLTVKIFFLITFLFSFGLITTYIHAHSDNKESFFSINSEYSSPYPLYITSLSNFNLPQDLDTTSRLVGQNLLFEIDTLKLSVPSDIVKQSTFFWDYGDGSKATGLKNNHTYNKIGSYILTVNVQSPDSVDPILLQSVLINVLPNKDYVLPKAVLLINNKETKDPLTDLTKVDFSQPINFSAAKSQSQSKIISYFWDFGDTQSSDQITVAHQYDAQTLQYFPLLRIKTADGFIADTFAEVQGDELASPTPASQSTTKINMYQLVGGIAVLLILAAWKFWPKRNQIKTKSIK